MKPNPNAPRPHAQPPAWRLESDAQRRAIVQDDAFVLLSESDSARTPSRPFAEETMRSSVFPACGAVSVANGRLGPRVPSESSELSHDPQRHEGFGAFVGVDGFDGQQELSARDI
jgi:hypothetical protein